MAVRRFTREAETTAPTDPEAARAAAVTLLARRDFAARELHERLIGQGFEESTVASVLAGLSREAVIDDGRYAHNYVAYHAGRGHGPLRIAMELRRRGLAAPLIDAAIAGGPDWTALARKVCRAKFGVQAAASWAQQARRARFLQYRGFSSDHVRAATGADPDTGSLDP